jgi:predicted CoA-binding protein
MTEEAHMALSAPTTNASPTPTPPPRKASLTIKDAASAFLSHKRVAVTGVSRTPGNHGSNVVYKRLRERSYEVFAVNPNADEVDGDRAYRDLRSIPGGVEAVVIGTRPETADETMRECAELGIKNVWMHRRGWRTEGA